MTFGCFDRTLGHSAVEDAVRKGDYSFQEYAVFNWIFHVDCLVKYGKVGFDKEMSEIKDAIAYLSMHHIEQSRDSPLTSDRDMDIHDETMRADPLENCRKLYVGIDAICGDGMSQGKRAFLY